MSFEWNSSNGRGRLRIFSDDFLQRFDKHSGALDMRTRNTMIVHEDSLTGERRIIVGEEVLVWEDDRYVYMHVRGNMQTHTERMLTPTPTRIRRSNITPIGIYDP